MSHSLPLASHPFQCCTQHGKILHSTDSINDSYRDYGSATSPCAISGDPPLTTITTGSDLPTANSACSGPGQRSAISSANFSTDATGLGSVTLNGTLSVLPVRNETCFGPGALGSATDTYRVCSLLIRIFVARPLHHKVAVWCDVC